MSGTTDDDNKFWARCPRLGFHVIREERAAKRQRSKASMVQLTPAQWRKFAEWYKGLPDGK